MGLLDLFKKKSAKSKDLSETIPEKEKKYYQPDSYYTDVAFEGTQFEKKVITFEERKKTAIPSDNGFISCRNIIVGILYIWYLSEPQKRLSWILVV